MVMNPGITENAANFLISLETTIVSQQTVLCEVMFLVHQNCIHTHSMFLKVQSVHCFPPGLLPSQNQIQVVPKTLQCCETYNICCVFTRLTFEKYFHTKTLQTVSMLLPTNTDNELVH